MEKAKYIDHTLLKAMSTEEDIKRLCEEAIEYKFKSVCVNPANVKIAADILSGSGVLVCTVVGFPLGANTTNVKCYEAMDAINNGADEIDMVINIGKAKDHDYAFVKEEIAVVKRACKNHTLKVILETCYLTKDEIRDISVLACEAKADYVKTSTGFGTSGALVEDVMIMREAVGPTVGVKASGGIKTKKDFDRFVEAGASRIGTSNGVGII